MASLRLKAGASVLLVAFLLLPINALVAGSEVTTQDYHYGFMAGKENPDLYLKAISNTPMDIPRLTTEKPSLCAIHRCSIG